MSDITISGLGGFDGIEFQFKSPLDLIPTQPFPESAFTDGELPITAIKAKANKKFNLGDDAKNVEFTVGAEGLAALGVYRNKQKLLNALKRDGLDEPLANLLQIKIADTENLMALRWGYGFDASVKGKLALSPIVPGVNLSFGASGQTTGLSVLLHSRSRTDTVFDSIKETLQSWRVPRQVKTISDLNPQTTVLYETMGKLNVSLGVEYGYNFSWAREAIKIGALSGDLSLKIEMAIGAQFGFSTSGLYAISLSRESAAEQIRVQIFRLNQKNWKFAFDGAISAQADKIPFPDNIDDFIKGVFNLNGSQVLKDFEKILDPNTKIEDLISEELVDYARNLVKKVTGIDPVTAAEQALEKFRELVEKWHALPHEITALLYGFLNKAVDLKDLKGFLGKIISVGNDPTKITAEITKHLTGDFFNSPIGKWLVTVSKQGLMALLANIETERQNLIKWAEKTLGLLDGGTVEKMLENLQKWIDEKLNLDKIVLLNPDEWLKRRLSDFLGKQNLLLKELEQIRRAVQNLRSKSAEFYKIGYEALLAKYTFEVHYAFSRTTTRDALLDVTLDFSGAKSEQAEKCLANILDGDFAGVLTGRLDPADPTSAKLNCVTINQAVFTHGINRTTHLDVGIPYFKAFVDHITEAVASGSLIEKDGGRLWVFNLKATDTLQKKKSLSQLSIEASLTESAELRTFSNESYQTSYKFLYGKKGAKRQFLITRYEPAIDEYLRDSLPSFSDYLDELDRHLDSFGLVGANKFGNILTSLEISMPGKVIAAWKNIPADPEHEFYKKMSFVVQRRLRQWIPVAFIDETDDYDNLAALYPLLVYMALPMFSKRIDDRFFYWDYDNDTVQNEVFELHCRAKLLSDVLPEIRKSTLNAGYDDSKIEAIKASVFSSNRFETLCGLEKNIVKSIAKTCQKFLEFLQTPVTQPQKRLKALAEFGKEFTDTFNDDLGHIDYTPKGALRPLGLILIKDLADLLDPNLGATGFSAMLELAVLKSNLNFETARDKFFKGERPTADQTFVQQRIVGVRV